MKNITTAKMLETLQAVPDIDEYLIGRLERNIKRGALTLRDIVLSHEELDVVDGFLHYLAPGEFDMLFITWDITVLSQARKDWNIRGGGFVFNLYDSYVSELLHSYVDAVPDRSERLTHEEQFRLCGDIAFTMAADETLKAEREYRKQAGELIAAMIED